MPKPVRPSPPSRSQLPPLLLNALWNPPSHHPQHPSYFSSSGTLTSYLFFSFWSFQSIPQVPELCLYIFFNTFFSLSVFQTNSHYPIFKPVSLSTVTSTLVWSPWSECSVLLIENFSSKMDIWFFFRSSHSLLTLHLPFFSRVFTFTS